VSSIVVTGANGQVGRALVPRLQDDEHKVTALVRNSTNLRAHRVVTDWLQNPAAAQALAEADFVVHLAGEATPGKGNSFEAANVRTTRRVVDAIAGSRVQKVLFLSYPGADERSSNAYLRSKGVAEELIVRSGHRYAIFRMQISVVARLEPGEIVTALMAKPGKPVPILGSGLQQVQPCLSRDVIAALVAAISGPGIGTFELFGPDRMTQDDLVRLVNGRDDVRIRHIPRAFAGLVGRLLPTLSPELAMLMTRTCTGDHTPVERAFGISMTSVRAAWR